MASPTVDIIVKWSGKEYKICDLSEMDTVLDLKKAIQRETCVLPERQKLLGLKYKGKPPGDEILLSGLKLKPGSKIMMMGTTEEILADVVEPPTDMPDVVNDFDIEDEEIAIENREEYLAKVDKRIRDYKIDILSEPRPDKKLLVLDMDYTLFDHKSTAETGAELMRPYLHDFLASAYEDYDICIWSATSMKWIKAKMEELGMSEHPNYKVSFILDSLAMITVHTPKYGIIEVKPLGVVWGKFEHWDKTNTIMFDDLRRNFIMNPQNGLKIRPFRQAHLNRHKDTELVKLSKYLKDIAALEDLSGLRHRKWERYSPSKSHKRRRQDKKDEDSTCPDQS